MYPSNYSSQQQSTVYYDPSFGYYTRSQQPRNIMGSQMYINPGIDPRLSLSELSPEQLQKMGISRLSGFGQQSSPASQWANRQPYQYNAPSAQQLFPSMGNPMMGTMPTQAQGNPMLGGGNFGAGRFLGQGYANQTGLLGSNSTSMLGT